MEDVLITVFTPTFNRGYIIEDLYNSLSKQKSFNFEWLIIDDGSTDDTSLKIDSFIEKENDFLIRYYKNENSGKPRAINRALNLAKGKYIFIADSDDKLTEDAIIKLEKWIDEIDNIDDIVGVGAAKGFSKTQYIKGVPPKISLQLGYIDATNIDRKDYDLDADMCEAYKVGILKKFKFEVWEGEKFSPEEIVLNEMALNGYRVRWHRDIIYICDYLSDGLTKGSWSLLKNNPMGYSMLYNHKLKYTKEFKKKFNYACQHIALAIVGKEFKYILKSNSKLVTVLAIPFGYLLSLRRKKQFKCKVGIE